MSRIACVVSDGTLEALSAETDFSLYTFGESMKMFFDMLGAKITLDRIQNDGEKVFYQENFNSDLMDACLDTIFLRLRRRLRYDFLRYRKGEKKAADHSREEKAEESPSAPGN